jgi:DNA helicase-2/ATP-dependent DNA helicase PcrA
MDSELSNLFEQMSLKLNPAQKDAVDTIDGPVMLVAGPGSGKTQTIAMRIANILKQTQLNPENILCLTFTDSAVNTMRRRLISIIGPLAYNVRIYTFHGFCNEVIQNHPGRFADLGDKIEPLNDIDKLKIISSLIEQLPFDSVLKPFGRSETYIRDIQTLISGFKRDNIEVTKIEEKIALNIDFYTKTKHKFQELKSLHYRKLNDTVFTQFFVELQNLGFASFPFVIYLMSLYQEFGSGKLTQLRNNIIDQFQTGFSSSITAKQVEFVKIFKNYQTSLKDEGKYDYDDMIISVVNRFKSDKELLSEYQERYQYILVDEFQDTNSSQNEVLRLLGSFWPDPNIFVVGDDDQSIFRFQGASVENMAFFYNTYLSKIKVITLTENYRSHQLILDASRSVIKHNGLQIDEMIPNINKNLHASNTELVHQKIEVCEYKDPWHESSGIVNRIKGLIDQGVKGKDIAIIYRDNRDADDMVTALNGAGLKYRLEKGENILDSMEIRKLINLLNYLIDPDDAKTLFVILNYDFWGFNSLDLAKIYTYARENKLSYQDIISSKEHLEKATVSEPLKFTELSQKLLDWRQGMYNQDAITYFNRLLEQSGFLASTMAKPDSTVILNKLARLYQELKTLSSTQEQYNLSEFISDLEVYERYGIEMVDKLWGIDSDESIRMMTAHGAKGQEFSYVFIIKCQDRKWGARPSMNRIKPPFGLMQNQLVSVENDEERRLFYVAMTRAKQGLYISYSRFNNKQKENNPSKFIKEIPEEYINYNVINRSEQEEAQALINIVKADNNVNFSELGRNLIENILKDFRLNVSNIISYRKCPRCFFYNSILRIPSIKSKSAALGSGIHYALKGLMESYMNTGQIIPLENVLQDFAYSLKSDKLEERDFLDALKQGQKLLTDYYQDKQASFPQKSLNEVNFSHQGIVIDDVPISGKIDRIDFLDNQNSILKVIDYKTGNPASASSRLSVNNLGDYYLQLVFYKLLVENSHTIKGNVTQGLVEFIQKDNNDQYVSKEFTLNPESTTPVIALMKETYQKIMALDFTKCNSDTYNACDNPHLHELPLNF